MENEKIVEAYFESKKFSWNEASKKNYRSVFKTLTPLIGKTAENAWEALEPKSPYTRVNMFIALIECYDFCLEEKHFQGDNIYRVFRKRNKRLFRNVYQPKYPKFTFEEARKLILSIPDSSIRRKALELLGSGCRYAESFTYHEGKVLGKGSKPRAVFMPTIAGESYHKSHTTFWRTLAHVGLKPHDLRKLATRQMADNGIHIIDITHAQGWNSPLTAMKYVGASENLMQKVKKALA